MAGLGAGSMGGAEQLCVREPVAFRTRERGEASGRGPWEGRGSATSLQNPGAGLRGGAHGRDGEALRSPPRNVQDPGAGLSPQEGRGLGDDRKCLTL